jgi:RNA polymerase sigma-70 factor (ECF subfamily)
MSSEAAAYFSNALPNAAGAGASAVESLSKSGSPERVMAIESPGKEQSDEDLLLQVGIGSKEALSVLFQRHARSVFNVAHRILRDGSEAEDLLQELFLFLFQKAQVFDATKSSATSWIIQMTYHRAIDRRRYLDVRHHYNSQELQEDRLQTTNGQVSINELAARTLLNRLREEISAEQRQTLELHFFEGYSFREIAEKTGQTLGNVRNHYYRGLEKLRSYISHEKHA